MDASADLLKVNHRLESRVPEIGLLGSEGGATSSVVPTPIGDVKHITLGTQIFCSANGFFYRWPGSFIKLGHRNLDRLPARMCVLRSIVMRREFGLSASFLWRHSSSKRNQAAAGRFSLVL